MKFLRIIRLLSATTALSPAWAAAPVVSNVIASQRPGTKLVDIRYDVTDADGGTVTVEVNVSGDGGLSYLIPASTFTGAVGPGVSLGTNKLITWNAGADWSGNFVPSTKVRVTAHDGASLPAPFGMVYIPGGPFQMGDNLDGTSDAPVHDVVLTAFFMDKYEVTKDYWEVVRGWSLTHGYDISAGSADGTFHPIQTISWYDAVKWCNARSEYEGLPLCYYTDATQATPYRSGSIDVRPSFVNWNVTGYRLPTEAEWEKAARGGIQGKRYPWGDTVTHSNANYIGNPIFSGTDPDTAPTGQFPANDYGLFDMAGNVWEWCFDGYAPYVAGNDPAGPDTSTTRILRGGSWSAGTNFLMNAQRVKGNYSGTSISYNIGSTGGGTSAALTIRSSLGVRCVRR